MPAKVPTKGALGACHKLKALLKALPPARWTTSSKVELRGESPDWAEGIAKIQRLILDEGGSFKNDWNGATVRLWGFKATSTSGLHNACHNWCAQVTLKSAAAAMEGYSR